MADTPQPPPRIAILMTGRLSVRNPDGTTQKIVIQRVGNKFGNGRRVNDRYQLQVRRHVEHVNDRMSGAQLLRRARFTAAVEAWQGLTAEERAAWKAAASRKGKIAYNLFLSRYLKLGAKPPPGA